MFGSPKKVNSKMIPYADILVTLICVQVQARERERERREGDQRERDLID